MSYVVFGHTLSATTRDSLFNKMTGNDKEGAKANNTLRQKQSKLFRGCAALVFAYDNYQRGMTLQEQRGKHSSAFFKGTHQCAHKVYPFADCTFDEFHAYFSQHDQDIPSPWGMHAFEIVEDDNFAEFLVTYNDFDTLATPTTSLVNACVCTLTTRDFVHV